MPRSKFKPDPSLPYHIGARSNNRDWFALSLVDVWNIYSDYLWFIHHSFGMEIHSFVLMNNHFHLLASFPKGNISSAMNYFMRETSRVIGFESGRINHVYGSRFYRSSLNSNHYFEHAYKYVYRNPVAAGICERVEDYPFSTMSGLLGKTAINIPVCEDTMLFESRNFRFHMEWLNTTPSEEATDAVRRALMKPTFKLPYVNNYSRRHPLEDSRY